MDIEELINDSFVVFGLHRTGLGLKDISLDNWVIMNLQSINIQTKNTRYPFHNFQC